jgi:hypothetical protein
MIKISGLLLAAVIMLPTVSSAQEHHAGMDHGGGQASVTEPGQGAFAAIAEVVARLREDPRTDWTRVDIDALRAHLIDMNNVTLRSVVAMVEVPGGARFTVSAVAPDVVASIRRMVMAHAETMDDPSGWRYTAATSASGAELTVTGDEAQIRALGFIGVMTIGMHHQAHHWAIATESGLHD